MKNEYGIVGVAHIGLPTNDLKKTIEFYKSLGFEVILENYNEKQVFYKKKRTRYCELFIHFIP